MSKKPVTKLKTKDKHLVEARQAFADRLKVIMLKQDIHQADIARVLGVSRSAVNWWTNAAAYPSLENVQRLADLLRTTPEFLLFGVEKKTRDRMSESIPVIDRIDGRKSTISHLMLPREFLVRSKIRHMDSLRAVTIYGSGTKDQQMKETIVVADMSDRELSTKSPKLMVLDDGKNVTIGAVRRKRAKKGEIADMIITYGEQSKTVPFNERMIVGRAAAFVSSDL